MDLTRLDSDAVRAVQRLGTRGFETYLVGGCVRDLLLDLNPKDFDIATAARPQQVKRAFPRNCRIIGRRFKLAHLHFDGNRKILEVATFRSNPIGDDDGSDASEEDGPETENSDAEGPDTENSEAEGTEDESSVLEEETGEIGDDDASETDDESEADDDQADDDTDRVESEGDDGDGDDMESADNRAAPAADLLILRDNEFGTVEEDAVRRDFTINALFLDPVKNEIIDFVGGLQDVEDRVIRTIGDPETRFREDPVRILRAAKFAGRLWFHLDGPTEAAMRATSADLSRAAPPRVLEEILRLLRGGHALPSFQILRDVGGLEVLLPHVHAYLESVDREERRIFWRLLDALDNHIHNGGKPSSAVTLGCLFLRPILRLVDGEDPRSLTSAVEEVIGPLAQELRLPRREAGALKRICAVHPRFTATGKRRFRLASFLQDPHLAEAAELFELSCYALGENFEQLEHWREQIAEHAPAPEPVAETPRRGRSRGRDRDRDRSRPAKERDSRPSDRKPSRRKQQDESPGRKKKAVKKTANRSPRKRKEDEVLTIEPETYDLSAFDRELAPREVPRFDTIVDSKPSKKRRRPQISEDDSYKPPPPPGADAGAPTPPPAPTDDVFGDW